MKLVFLLVLGVWLGMVLGISFLEAPLKFQAPNITTVLGLGIGKLVFSALNKVEIVFATLLAIYVVKEYSAIETMTFFALAILFTLIVIQSIWLLPLLNARVDKLLQGIEVPATNHHFIYVAMECSKVILLVFSFIKIYKK